MYGERLLKKGDYATTVQDIGLAGVKSRSKCKQCDRRHYTSTCDLKEIGNKEKTLLISTEQNAGGIFPIVQIKLDGIECRALIDAGAGSSYTSAKLINLLKKKTR